MVLPWKVTLTVPESGILSGTSIVEDPTKNQWGGAGGTHYLTKEQVQAWTEGIYWADAEENRVATVSVSEIAEISFQASDGKSYTLNEILNHTTENADSLTYTICKMTLKDVYKRQIVATGGLAKAVIPHCRHDIIIDENLLLKGLQIIYEKNR